MWNQIILACLIVIATLVYFALKAKKRNNMMDDSDNDSRKSILIVVGSGGHTREILCLVKVLGEKYQPRYYVVAETDAMSKTKLQELECENKTNFQYQLFTIPRSREVKQSYITSVLTTVMAVVYCFPLVFRLKPDVILCNGPGTCIPICIAGLFLKWLHIQRVMVVYVESICRIKSLSLSGKLLYHLADSFVVQWPELTESYPKSKYLGRLV